MPLASGESPRRSNGHRWASAPIVVALLAAACAAGTASPSPVPPLATPGVTAPATSPTPRPTPGLEYDLSRLDTWVRTLHPGPFTIHPESEWLATLDVVRSKLASAANKDEVFALFSRLGGLLDRHTFVVPEGGFHAYPILFYRFSDGWFVVAARDKALIGSALLSVGGHPVNEVEATLRPLVGFDNETGALDALEWTFPFVEYLHGAGIVTDPARPAFGLRLPNGEERTVDLPIIGEQEWGEELHIGGALVGDAPEAVARRFELAWHRIDEERRTFLMTVYNYGDTRDIHGALKKALDDGVVDRVVLDVRYMRGGNGDFPALDYLKSEPRVNRPGGLIVLIGRENESVATWIVREFDVNTEAILLGEGTPARADNFRCDCRDLRLEAAGVVVTIPTWIDNKGDDRPQVPPDVPMSLSSADFFAGRDPVLEAALAGDFGPAAP
jgi:hypothetical protein